MFRRSKLASAKGGGGGGKSGKRESYEWTEIWVGNIGFAIAVGLQIAMLGRKHLTFGTCPFMKWHTMRTYLFWISFY